MIRIRLLISNFDLIRRYVDTNDLLFRNGKISGTGRVSDFISNKSIIGKFKNNCLTKIHFIEAK